MPKKKSGPRAPELREFIKENDQRLYDFCVYMLHGSVELDDLVLEIFREFGDGYRRETSRRDSAWDPNETRTRLFQSAWERIRTEFVMPLVGWNVGRDTRQFKGLDEDLLSDWSPGDSRFQKVDDALVERLSRIDPDFRAPLVLRDILRFEDEDAVRILGIRWGVYRHRLHRGRLEFKDALRGRPITSEARSAPPPASDLHL